MTPQERQIVDLLQKTRPKVTPKTELLLERLMDKTFSCSPDFLKNELICEYFRTKQSNISFQFWYLIATYLGEEDKASPLSQLTTFLQKNFKYKSFQKELGTWIIPHQIARPSFIKNIYLFGDDQLIELIQQFLPKPRTSCFGDTKPPDSILTQERTITEGISKFLEKNNNELDTVEDIVKKIQRRFRSKLREKQERKRIRNRHFNPNFLDEDIEDLTEEEAEKKAEKKAAEFLKAASKVYRPKCSSELAQRLISLSSQIDLYSTVRHLTAEGALEQIFNQCLYGRKNLLEFYTPFKKAALEQADVNNGDANVICFGFNEIDPKAVQEIEIDFDLKKLIKLRAPAFYKVRDLEYYDDKIRKVRLNKRDHLYFTPTRKLRCDDNQTATFGIFKSPNRNSLITGAKLEKSALISYNLEEMSSIIILNFFKFIDKLYDSKYIEDFYNTLSKMNDKELKQFLYDAAKELSKTGEFNFYGAYQLDLSTITSIRSLNKKYTLDMKSLRRSLWLGDLAPIQKAISKIPTLFKSYRFLDDLIANTQHPVSKNFLIELIQQCAMPPWVKNYYETKKCTIQSAGHYWKEDLLETLEKCRNSTSIKSKAIFIKNWLEQLKNNNEDEILDAMKKEIAEPNSLLRKHSNPFSYFLRRETNTIKSIKLLIKLHQQQYTVTGTAFNFSARENPLKEERDATISVN